MPRVTKQIAKHPIIKQQPIKKLDNVVVVEKADDRIAKYTRWLAILTGGLVVANIIQFFFLYRADQTARISAETARKSAEHIPRVERAYLHGGGAPIGTVAWTENGVTKNFPTFRLDINNHGKTPGELLEYGIGWCKISEVDSLPLLPKYKWYYYRDFVQSNAPRPIKPLKMPSEWNINETVIFGRFGYRDIFGDPHSNGFIQHGGKPIKAPHISYTQIDPSWDLPHVGKRQYEEDDG
jgi:hypothetical protein